MATIQIGTLPPRDVLDLLDTLDNACAMLDTLAQMQSMVGGLSMESRASRTEDVLAKLQHYVQHLRHQQEKINR